MRKNTHNVKEVLFENLFVTFNLRYDSYLFLRSSILLRQCFYTNVKNVS